MPIGFIATVHTGKIGQKLVNLQTQTHNKQIDQLLLKNTDITENESKKINTYRFRSDLDIDGAAIKHSGQGLRVLFRAHLWMLANTVHCTGIVSVADWNYGHSGKNIILVGALHQLYQIHNAFQDIADQLGIDPNDLLATPDAVLKKLLPEEFDTANFQLENIVRHFEIFIENFLSDMQEEPTLLELLKIIKNNKSPFEIIHAILKSLVDGRLSDERFVNTDEKNNLVLTKFKLILIKENIIPAELVISGTDLVTSPTSANSFDSDMDTKEDNLETFPNLIPVNLYTVGTGSLTTTVLRGPNSIESKLKELKEQKENTEAELTNIAFYERFLDEMNRFVCNDNDANLANLGQAIWKTAVLEKSPSMSSVISNRSQSKNSSRSTTPALDLSLISSPPSAEPSTRRLRDFDGSPISGFDFIVSKSYTNSRSVSESGATYSPRVTSHPSGTSYDISVFMADLARKEKELQEREEALKRREEALKIAKEKSDEEKADSKKESVLSEGTLILPPALSLEPSSPKKISLQFFSNSVTTTPTPQQQIVQQEPAHFTNTLPTNPDATSSLNLVAPRVYPVAIRGSANLFQIVESSGSSSQNGSQEPSPMTPKNKKTSSLPVTPSKDYVPTNTNNSGI